MGEVIKQARLRVKGLAGVSEAFRIPRVRTRSIFPEWVHRDKQWLTCLLILDSPALQSKEIVRHYVDFERQTIRVRELLEQSAAWSSGERVLVQVAIDFFNGDGGASFKDLLDRLDGPNYHLVLWALGLYRDDWQRP